MTTRLLRVLLTLLVALSMMGTGLHAAAASAAGEPWPAPVQQVEDTVAEALLAGNAEPASPLPELQDPPDRDSLIDPPELFDTLRAPSVDGLDHQALRQPHTAAPPWPFLEGLRRPPRA
jgi:hypothetical protein